MFWLQNKFHVLIRSQKRTESLWESYLPSENTDHSREYRQKLRSYSIVCVCVCWGHLERKRLHFSTCHRAGTLLCLNGSWCLLVRTQTRVRIGAGRHTGPKDDFILWLVLPACIVYSSPCLESLRQRKGHTQNKLSQLDTEAKVFNRLKELFNVDTAKNFEIIIWKVWKQVQ